ncbi:hypothetical protein BDF14DRAFT_1885221 [Spinellus fusiger]|nr:hypothetical protein BDF14DRAFT_1885221 [Spinellus fusiger]
MPTLPPLLALSHEALSTLKTVDMDDLSVLWTVLAKCKTQLENGQRLENMAWRLWHYQHKSLLLIPMKNEVKDHQQQQTLPVAQRFLMCLSTPHIQQPRVSSQQAQSHLSVLLKPTLLMGHLSSYSAEKPKDPSAQSSLASEDLFISENDTHEASDIEDTTFAKTQPATTPRHSLLSLLLHQPSLTPPSLLSQSSCPSETPTTESVVGSSTDQDIGEDPCVELSESMQKNVVWEHIQHGTFHPSSEDPFNDPTEWNESFHGW